MPSLHYAPVAVKEWRGLKIQIENPAGTVRHGKSKTGVEWHAEMPYDYGYIDGSEGVDGDEVDVFLGPNKSAQFVYIMHQLKKESGEFDEQKCFLGFDNLQQAKEAYRKAYDLPDLFIGTMEAIPFNTFKEKVLKTKNSPELIHASKMNNAIQLFAEEHIEPITIGSEVSVPGFHGKGYVIAIQDGRATIKFRSGEYISRDVEELTNLFNRTTRSWRD